MDVPGRTNGATDSPTQLDSPSTREPFPLLAADPVDSDGGPTFVLVGRVVTMAAKGEVYDRGLVCVSNGAIEAVVSSPDEMPEKYSGAPRVDTGGTIFPGLMDLHNHFAYNVVPLWAVPQTYFNRGQWSRNSMYKSGVSLPVRALAGYAQTAKALVRYVETKALIAGTTTGQGIRTRVNGGLTLFRGAMRNVEETDDARLPAARTRVPNLQSGAEDIAAFRNALHQLGSYFYHLSEGTDDVARQAFLDLQANGLLLPKLVGIHSLGLEPGDLVDLSKANAQVVWSPFSNLLLYGRTLDLKALLDSGVNWSIGCDWSPTGSKNLLQELKVARFEASRQGALISDHDLVRGVTSGAAQVVGWGEKLGTIQEGYLADLVVVRGSSREPYDQLISAREADVDLVLVHGRARYGALSLMRAFHADDDSAALERLVVGGQDKALAFDGSALQGLTFDQAARTLTDAMSDLPSFVGHSAAESARLASMGIESQPFVVELDNEPNVDGQAVPGLLVDWTEITPSLTLDGIEVGGDHYWQQIDAQANLSGELKSFLQEAYA